MTGDQHLLDRLFEALDLPDLLATQAEGHSERQAFYDLFSHSLEGSLSQLSLPKKPSPALLEAFVAAHEIARKASARASYARGARAGLLFVQKRARSELEPSSDCAEGARDVLHALSTFLREQREEKAPPVLGLNSEAGSHPITLDPTELQAGLLAGEETWNAFPYYQKRYGARGAAFTRSDSAWLIQLAQMPDDAERFAQVLWLSRILSNRGMPSVLMEHHLLALGRHLDAVGSAAAPKIEPLARALIERRRAVMEDSILAQTERAFLTRSSEHSQLRVGYLLAGAYADERLGMAKAVESVVQHFTNPELYPSRDFRSAVSATIADLG